MVAMGHLLASQVGCGRETRSRESQMPLGAEKVLHGKPRTDSPNFGRG